MLVIFEEIGEFRIMFDFCLYVLLDKEALQYVPNVFHEFLAYNYLFMALYKCRIVLEIM